MQNQNANRDALLQALSGAQSDESFPDSKLQEFIDAEFSKPVEKMDCEVLDACYRLLERRHSPFSDRQIAISERRGLKQFKRFMKQSRVPSTNNRAFQFKPLAVAILAAIVIMAPVLITNKGFRISMPPDEQQYLVVGVQQNDTGMVRAMTDRSIESKTIHLNGIDEIPSILGYRIQLPTWIPVGYALSDIRIIQNQQYDDVQIEYTNGIDSIHVDITYFESRDGFGSSYEQDRGGRKAVLKNGVAIYLSKNVQSAWGLYQSSNLDYLIDGAELDEESIIAMYNSMEE